MESVSVKKDPHDPHMSLWEGEQDPFVEYVRRGKEDVDYKKIVGKDAQVFILGLKADQKTSLVEFLENLNVLSEVGFNTVVFSTLGSADGVGTGKEIKSLHRQFSPIVKKANEIGLEVVGIDLPMDQQRAIDGNTPIDQIAKLLQARSNYIANNIKEIIQSEPNRKVLVLTDDYLSDGNETEEASISKTLKNSGIKTKTAYVIGGGPSVYKLDPYRIDMELAVKEAELAQNRFMVAALEQNPQSFAEVDWIIHLPQQAL